MPNRYEAAFRELGRRYRKLRMKRRMVQEDAMDHGFSVRHYQQLEAGRPHSLTTLFRLAEMFRCDPAALLRGAGGQPAAGGPGQRRPAMRPARSAARRARGGRG